MSLAITSVVIAGLAVVVTMRLTTALIADRGGVRWSDLPFLSFVLLALVYLELSPSIAMVTRSLPRIALRQEHYVRQIKNKIGAALTKFGKGVQVDTGILSSNPDVDSSEAPIAIVRGRYRWRLLVKAPRDADLQGFRPGRARVK